MGLKQYFQYRIQFAGKWTTAAGVCAGLSFFLRCVFYFVITDLSASSIPGIIFKCIVPLLIAGAYLILLKCLHYNAPGLYGILGAVLCMVIIISSFTSGDILKVIYTIVWYLLVGALFLGTTAGLLPDKIFAVITLLIAVFVRIFTDSAGIQGSDILKVIGGSLPEISTTVMLLSLLCFLFSLQTNNVAE